MTPITLSLMIFGVMLVLMALRTPRRTLVPVHCAGVRP